MKKLSFLFAALALFLSLATCFTLGWNYRDALCGIEHKGYSAPAEIVFLQAIPQAVLVLLCVVVAVILYRKSNRGES